MPDIAKCENEECPSKEQCYRFTCKPSDFRQSYMGFEPEEGEDKCDGFMDNE